ncbi:hypothetical protein AC579_6580 [Pseudocercospora musae]|uniref:Uncharacterized protein n=1 Tax=Pseudocercospora musae TaxID=113226 RepID=A0A139I9X7_9PEZI|nr:hypothetical protein AC579_6580 [Pseudocercospora musae]
MASSSAGTTKKAGSPEAYDSLRRRNGAAEILQSYERLSWHAFKRCEVCFFEVKLLSQKSDIDIFPSQTITQTRMHFQGVVAGFTTEDEKKRIHWKEDFTPHSGHETKSSRKGKEGASFSGSAADSSSKAASSSRSREKKDRSSLGDGSKSPRPASKKS